MFHTMVFSFAWFYHFVSFLSLFVQANYSLYIFYSWDFSLCTLHTNVCTCTCMCMHLKNLPNIRYVSTQANGYVPAQRKAHCPSTPIQFSYNPHAIPVQSHLCQVLFWWPFERVLTRLLTIRPRRCTGSPGSSHNAEHCTSWPSGSELTSLFDQSVSICRYVPA